MDRFTAGSEHHAIAIEIRPIQVYTLVVMLKNTNLFLNVYRRFITSAPTTVNLSLGRIVPRGIGRKLAASAKWTVAASDSGALIGGFSVYHKLYKVKNFEIVGDYTIQIEFDDGSEQVIDFKPVLYGEMWGPLQDLSFSNQVELDRVAHTLTWTNGADFDPETLGNPPRRWVVTDPPPVRGGEPGVVAMRTGKMHSTAPP